jgi:hypothetical protein
MGTQLVGNLPLREDAAVWVVSRALQPPASVIDAWTAHRDKLAEIGQAQAGANSDLRAFLGGMMPEDGCRFFVDLKIPDGPEASQ